MTRPDPRELRDAAITIARAAGTLLLGARAGGLGLGELRSGAARKSSPTDLATDADRASESLVRSMLAEMRPDDAILGEEGGTSAGTSGYTWIVDPLDGTTNFVYDIPEWTVSVAVADADGTVAGAVHHPLTGELFAAARGLGATRDGGSLVRRSAPPLAEALIGTGFSYAATERARQGALLATVLPAVRDIRRSGSAALDLCWVASGRLDAFYESGLNSWDTAAGLLIAAESGVVSNELGDLGKTRTLVAAAPGLITDLIELLEHAARRL